MQLKEMEGEILPEHSAAEGGCQVRTGYGLKVYSFHNEA